MGFTTKHHELAKRTKEFSIELFEQEGVLNHARAAIDATDRWEQKECPLNALLVLSFVVFMSLDRARSINNLLKHLFSLLRTEDPQMPLKPLTPQAMMHARKRLGPEPLEAMFSSMAREIEPRPSFLGLRPWAVDGFNATMPDTPANEAEFGRPISDRGPGGFPQTRAVALVDATKRHVKDAIFGGCNDPERPAVQKLLHHLSDRDVVFMDRGISAVWLFDACRHTHFVGRIPAKWKPRFIRRLGEGDGIVEISGWPPAQSGPGVEPSRQTKEREIKMVVRLIEFKIGDGTKVRLITDLLDPVRYPARIIATEYHLRWESELSFKELKVHLETVTHGTLHTVFRSKSPDGVRQEAMAMLIAYNLIRSLMAEAADAEDIRPLEISFLESLEVIKLAIPRFQSHPKENLPWLARQLLSDIADTRLARPRRGRRYPRVVKVKMSNFKLKRDGHAQEHYDIEKELTMV